MSFDYYVAVHKDGWPTAAAVQAALAAVGAPIELEDRSETPFLLADRTRALALVFEGRKVFVEAAAERLVDASDPSSEFGSIAELVEPTFKIRDGDYGLVLTFRSDADEIRAGLFLAAAMILKFGGYGFENQLESHGGVEFAEGMLAEAANPEGWYDDAPRPSRGHRWLHLPRWLGRLFARRA